MAAWHQANTDSFQIARRRRCQAPPSTYTLRAAQRHWRHQRHLRPMPAPKAPWQICKKPRGLLIYLGCLQRNVSQLSILQTITWRGVGCRPWEKKHCLGKIPCRLCSEFPRLNLEGWRWIFWSSGALPTLGISSWNRSGHSLRSILKTVKDEQVSMVQLLIFFNTFVEFLVKVHNIYDYSINRIKMTRRRIKSSTFFVLLSKQQNKTTLSKARFAVPAKEYLICSCRKLHLPQNVRTCQDLCQLVLLWRMTHTHFHKDVTKCEEAAAVWVLLFSVSHYNIGGSWKWICCLFRNSKKSNGPIVRSLAVASVKVRDRLSQIPRRERINPGQVTSGRLRLAPWIHPLPPESSAYAQIRTECRQNPDQRGCKKKIPFSRSCEWKGRGLLVIIHIAVTCS